MGDFLFFFYFYVFIGETIFGESDGIWFVGKMLLVFVGAITNPTESLLYNQDNYVYL
jgi:hypothetical protein